MLSSFVNILLQFSSTLGYGGIVFLMAVESSFVPFPSELVVPPAAYLAAQGEMNLWLVFGAGVLGSLVGAVVNYVLARTLGRAIVYSLAKRHWMRYLLITHQKLEKAEDYFVKYGNVSTFVGRLIPGIRQLISLPAGFSKMPFGAFLLYTFLGSFFWVAVLTLSGYLLFEYDWFVEQYYWSIFATLVGLILLSILIYFRRKN